MRKRGNHNQRKLRKLQNVNKAPQVCKKSLVNPYSICNKDAKSPTKKTQEPENAQIES